MHIKSIVLDGFKSYGQRTEINGFDPEFNAITGLNGTGKSNILDSICFVLGITQLSNVRVTSLQDLVYKSGQSGVTKATVSITFDNRNKEQSPVGFEEYNEITVTRQVVMGGKNKYLINGVGVQNKRVQDMFCSVQLNVNNPHFLIMQGRITKVLNMKPPEILSMIEEAAGTRMYEVKKLATQKTIEKKDAKLLELGNLVREEITPKLNKLKDERKLYLEYQRNERELQNLTGIYLAWQFLTAKKLMQKTHSDLEQITEDIEKFESDIETNNERAKQIDDEVAEHQTKDSASNKELNAIEEKVKEKEKILAKANAVEKTAKVNITNEETKMKQLSKGRTDDEAALNTKEQELNNMEEMFQSLREADAADAEALLASQRKFEAISAGMVIGEDGEAETLQEQLIKAKQDAAEAATEVRKATMQLKHNQTQLKDKQKDIDSSATDYKKDKANVENLDKELKNITKQLQNLNFDENKMTDLQDRKRTLKHECRGISERMGRFEAQYPQSDFQYQDPEPNFNRRSVKGLVCKLLSVKDRKAATALETAAGGRLFNVITDTEVTSKKLLQGGQLQYRTTIIPLNKIKGNCISRDTVNYAQELVGKENVQPALSLIQFSNELQPAMEYIFGNVFICKDMNIAKRVTFDKHIMRKCVTLEGDVVDPSGTLSGGATKQGGSFLLLLEEYKGYQAELQAKEQELLKLEAEIQNLQKVSEKYTELKHKYDITSHNLSMAQRCLQQTSYYQQQEEIDNLKKTIAELTQTIDTCNQKEKSNLTKAKDIEDKIKNAKGNREQELKEAEAEMKKLKKQSENSKKLWKQKEQDFETLKLEISELKKSIVVGEEQIQVSEKALAELKEDYEVVHKDTEEAQATVTKLQDEYKERKAAISAQNKEVQKKLQEKNKLLNKISDMELEIKKLNHKKKELEKKCQEYKAKEAELQKKLKKDDTRLRDAEEMSDEEGLALQTRIAKAQEAVNKLKRTVNTKAQSMFDQEEKQYTSLLKKKIVVENDKKKLLSLIEELDKKKICFLKTAYEQISKDFGSIFNTLLPGTDAKLKPPEGKSILDGLEIKVGIGGIWKESLSELSGGQKSLVALSLILAMLLFKPAPLYILDEVDAALDLSHTQNIGTMLRKHFKHSQFVIVSLKDGMFNNANVLFRTKFVDGMSGIIRTTNK